MNREVKIVTEEPTKVKISEDVTVSVQNKVRPWLCDKKVVRETTGVGGACCTFCTSSRDDLHNPDCVKDGFPMNRTMEAVLEIAKRLFDDESGEIQRYRENLTSKARGGERDRESE